MAVVPPKLYRIGEIAQATGLSRQVLHQYTTLGLISEATRTASGQQRLYGPEVFAKIERLQQLKERLTLAEIRRLLEDEARAPGAPGAAGAAGAARQPEEIR